MGRTHSSQKRILQMNAESALNTQAAREYKRCCHMLAASTMLCMAQASQNLEWASLAVLGLAAAQGIGRKYKSEGLALLGGSVLSHSCILLSCSQSSCAGNTGSGRSCHLQQHPHPTEGSHSESKALQEMISRSRPALAVPVSTHQQAISCKNSE